MDRTFSMEYSAMKGERAQHRSNKKKHGKLVDCRGPPGDSRGGGHECFLAEHGSTGAQKAREVFFKESEWAARRRDKSKQKSNYEPQDGRAVEVKANRSKAERNKAHEKIIASRKPNKAARVVDLEQEEADGYRGFQKHVLVPEYLFGAPGVRRAPRPVRRRVVASDGPAPRRRKPGADALMQRTLALGQSPPALPEAVDEVARIAAARLRRLRPDCRPASGPVFLRWLKHQGCCTVRVEMLMTPGALAEALLPLLEDSPPMQRAIAPFAKAGRGVDTKDPGPRPEDLEAAARRARNQLRLLGEKRFCSWPWPQCARWLCSQSYAILNAEAGAVLAELRRLGAIVDGSAEGRIGYSEEALKAVGEPRVKRAEWCLLDLEKVARVAMCQRSKISLGWGLGMRERSKSLELGELGKLKAEWLARAASELGDRAPGIVSLRAKFNKAKSAVMLYMCVLGSEQSAPAEEASEAVLRAAKDDIAKRHSPRTIRIEDLTFRGPLRDVSILQNWLACEIDMERDEEYYLTGCASIVFARHSRATNDQVREILKVAYSPDPPIRCPGLLKADEAAWLASDPVYQRDLSSIVLRSADVVLEAWRPELAEPGGEGQEEAEEGALDLCGWPALRAWRDCPCDDLSAAPAWFRDEVVPKARERLLERWEERLQWFPEGRERMKMIEEEIAIEKEAAARMEEDLKSGKKVLVAGGTTADGGGYPSKRW